MRSPLLIITFIISLFFPAVVAQSNTSASVSCQEPLELALLEGKSIANDENQNIVTDRTISQDNLTVPSLWWAKEQFDPYGNRTIVNWIAYRDRRRIDLVVNRQLWSLLNYVERYRLVNKFGTTAREYGYNLRIFDRQKKCLVTYSCDFKTTPNQCKIDFEPSGRAGLQIERNNLNP
jgi:hypothetical protein